MMVEVVEVVEVVLTVGIKEEITVAMMQFLHLQAILLALLCILHHMVALLVMVVIPRVMPVSVVGSAHLVDMMVGMVVVHEIQELVTVVLPAEAPVKVKQCDGDCGDSCDNSRIYISNLPPDVNTEELRELFGGIGQVGRIKQKRGYKDQWPWNIKIYTDEQGNNKGDAVLSYEDPSAAHSAGSFYNNHDMRGYKISVAMAEKTALRAPSYGPGGGGRGGYGGGGDRRRDNYRDGGGSGPDRNYHGVHNPKWRLIEACGYSPNCC
ncbi:hypothetical protein F0562_001142 [Nyssa sinensis]|uniref:RRM domain-containing protein n=1 Tax=Nyssa sinensis TaxID=561372 RepID=A0A5J5C2D8_9ASTE|nr:hypothetical protein F0562_001142 [Nyssa sinensis]